MSEHEQSTGGTEQKEYEVIVGFAGSSRTTLEVVEAKDRGEAGRQATGQYGCTAVVSEVFKL
jgi:hypothetical protein